MSDEKKAGYMFRIGCQTADGITVDMTGNFEIGATDATINKEFDRMVNIFSRQRAKTVLAGEELSLKNDRAALESEREELRKASEKETKNMSEKQHIVALKQSIASFETRIAARESGIESLKALI